jgi:hypothetical protein
VSLKIGVIAAKDATVEQLAGLLEAAGQEVAARAVVPKRTTELRTQLERWIEDPAIELVIGIASSTMRGALLPLITKRLVGFMDLKEVDGGCCKSTIVLLVPRRDITRELLDDSLARVSRELQPRPDPANTPPTPIAHPRTSPTKPPPLARGPGDESTPSLSGRASTGDSTPSSISRRAPTTPPPFRVRGKTSPPPLPSEDDPPDDGPDFIIEHKRPPHVEFEVMVTEIKPVRLERLPVVLSPIARTPRKRRRRRRSTWRTIGIATVAGALVGGLLAWRERATSSASVSRSSASVAVSSAPVVPSTSVEPSTSVMPSTSGVPSTSSSHAAVPEARSAEPEPMTVEDMTAPEVIVISEDEAIDVSRPETIEMPPVPVRATDPATRQPASPSDSTVPSAAEVWSGETGTSRAISVPDALRTDDMGASNTDDAVTSQLRCHPGELEVGPLPLPLAIDREIIRAAISAMRPAVRRCGKLYPWRGVVTLLIYVRGDGGVASASVKTAPAIMLGQCIATAVTGARFAPTRKGGAFTYPFKF